MATNDNLTIIFKFLGNNWSLQCKKSDLIDDVFQRFCVKAQVNKSDLKFYYNSAEVRFFGKTLEQLGMNNFFQFDVVSEKYVSGA